MGHDARTRTRTMTVLGIESTAHTFGVGIVEAELPASIEALRDTTGKCRILANRQALYRPPPLGDEGGTTGGIHPREAANHHAEHAPRVLREALDEASVGLAEVDAIAFSRSPGLGPSLRTGATVARALALRHDVALLGVNHCVAHLEIARTLCGVDDPLLLYASGGNTQVIAYAEGRYRVFGETLDVGVGNFLDKFARSLGLPFPGGPKLEKLALDGDELLDLPYSVKGMDMAFSGILTAADALVAKGHRPEDVAFSVQETVFAMLTEVTERALAHVGKTEVALGGGVACNERLTEMVRLMCEERGAGLHRPPKPVLVDNGAMIAWTGALQHVAGQDLTAEASQVDQRQRTDQVDAPWRRTTVTAGDPTRGAEATIRFQGEELATKERTVKTYRHPALDARLRRQRTRLEAQLLAVARTAGVITPIVLDVDPTTATIAMERLHGPRLRDVLDEMAPDEQARTLAAFGRALGRLHAAGIAHGDPTTSNAFLEAPAANGGTASIAERPQVVLIDLGLAQYATEAEDFATDLHVLDEALEATHRGSSGGFEAVLDGYELPERDAVLKQLEAVRARGRYRGT